MPSMNFRLVAARPLGDDMNKVVNAVVGGWQVCPDRHLAHRLAVARLRCFGRVWNILSRRACRLQLALPSITGIRQLLAATGGIQWFTNNGNFTNPAKGTFGNCAAQLGGLRGPHYTDLDLGLPRTSRLQSGSNCNSELTSSTPLTTYNTTRPTWALAPAWVKLPAPNRQGTFSSR